jgi:hypothetical protein
MVFTSENREDLRPLSGWDLIEKNQGLIDPDQVFNRDHVHAQNFTIKACLKKINQSLLKNFQSKSDEQKLTRFATALHARE